ncbi:NADH-quinone oxidoreductase subunit H [Sulfurospirillum sp. T05]|uniref:NADH-quinone oxidoreductase subunit H n=2 Tax=Sulfurospirillum tamanense TaxID=2813362 RepID=A0ABS2WV60_9BACT|nr:NADH-quinone oxidoreductase subunit H [Sulfurospirillum tamanensis]MBN2965537.1 NADH-quinone oxidoreductase subunit H [Sulfurospirillum tamanensis]
MAPFLGTFVSGIDRRVRARMQRRVGPPLLQPFYDMFKLLDKRPMMVHGLHVSLGAMHFIALWVSIGIIMFGGHLLYAIFMHLLSSLFLVLAGYSVRSPFSHLGANRELLAIAAYEPVLILMAVGFYLHTGSFEVGVILSSPSALWGMPLMFLALLIILPIKLKKSPFDAPEAHQEVVGGVEVEFSGTFYEVIYMAKMTEIVFVYSLVFLFGGAFLWLGALLVIAAFLLVSGVDNASARIRIDHLVRTVYISAFVLAVLAIGGMRYV